MKHWAIWLLLVLSGAAGAADWVIVHTAPEGDQYYYDASRLTIGGNEITYWKKVAFKSPYSYKGQQVASALHRERIHCAEHTVKSLTHIVHGVSGAVVEHAAADGEAATIIPETIGDVFEQTLCALVKLKRDEETRKAMEKEKIEPPAPPPYNDGQPPPPPPGTL